MTSSIFLIREHWLFQWCRITLSITHKNNSPSSFEFKFQVYFQHHHHLSNLCAHAWRIEIEEMSPKQKDGSFVDEIICSSQIFKNSSFQIIRLRLSLQKDDTSRISIRRANSDTHHYMYRFFRRTILPRPNWHRILNCYRSYTFIKVHHHIHESDMVQLGTKFYFFI